MDRRLSAPGVLDPLTGFGVARARSLALLAGEALLAGVLGACGSAPDAAACASDARLVFEPGGATHDLCEPYVSVQAADGAASLVIGGGLPSTGPWGRGSGGARFVISVEPYPGPGRGTGTATLSYAASLTTMEPLGPTWSGPCEVDVGQPGERATFQCTLSAEADPGDLLQVAGDAPAPDLTFVPAVRATYRIGGAYRAEGTTAVALDPGAQHGVPRQMIPLADGGRLQLLLEGDPDGRVSLHGVPADSPAIAVRAGHNEDGAFTPSFGACAVAIDPDTWTGTVSCPGDPSSPAGSATLELVLEATTP